MWIYSIFIRKTSIEKKIDFPTINFGNIYYLLIIAFLVVSFTLIYFLLKNKSKRTKYITLLVWCFINFSLHFLKQLFYLDPNQFSKSTLENICAVSTFFFPFIMLLKKESPLHDFMYFIGIIGGLSGIIYPTEALDKAIFTFETIRFYFCHFSLLAIPLLLAIFDIYKPRLKMWYMIPLCFLVYEMIICINSGLLIALGIKTQEGMSKIELFLDNQYVNNSFVFGPTPDTGKLGEFIGSLCPDFMKIDIFHINNNDVTYWPVLWLIVPSFILFVPMYFLISFPFFIDKNTNYNFSKKAI